MIEIAPSPRLDPAIRDAICDAAVRLAREARYQCAGTVEFLLDADSGDFYFIEVNPRVQVEHTVTEVVTGIDIVKAQIRVSEGAAIGSPESGVPAQEEIRVHGSAMQCRITTEDPENHFIPDYGRITAYREATGFGIRLDGGTAYSSAVITPFYDSLLEKVTAWAPTHDEAIHRMDRALREFRIRGVKTNLPFLEALVAHPPSSRAPTPPASSTRPRAVLVPPRRDRATRLLNFIGDVLVNGTPRPPGGRSRRTSGCPPSPRSRRADRSCRARAIAFASSAPRASRRGCARSAGCC